MRTGRHLTIALAAGAALALPGSAFAADTPVSLTGIGPLKLGMTETAAKRTGWLSNKAQGCELARPIPTTYRLDGPQAPRAIVGSVEFSRGRLRAFTFSKGVRTAQGVVPGKTTVSEMVRRYRAAGYTARSEFVDTFGGTFVTVKKGSRFVIGGFATTTIVRHIGIPSVSTCE